MLAGRVRRVLDIYTLKIRISFALLLMPLSIFLVPTVGSLWDSPLKFEYFSRALGSNNFFRNIALCDNASRSISSVAESVSSPSTARSLATGASSWSVEQPSTVTSCRLSQMISSISPIKHALSASRSAISKERYISSLQNKHAINFLYQPFQYKNSLVGHRA